MAELDPILVTGRTVACSRATAAELIPWLEAQSPALRGTLNGGAWEGASEPAPDDLLTLSGSDAPTLPSWDDTLLIRAAAPAWQPRHYVPLVTAYFEAGRSRCLVGTRGLLGEGWDAKSVNVLIDLTAAGTPTAVHQMRGRSLRLDPALPRKVANNWDVVCVDAGHPKGAADYARFVRKHHVYYAPTIEGEIESGVSHVHHALSPFGPPAADFERLNRELLARAEDRKATYERWRIGQPYVNRATRTVRLRFERSLGLPTGRLLHRTRSGLVRPTSPLNAAWLVVPASYLLAANALGQATALVLSGLVAGSLAITRLGYALRQSLSSLGPSDALEDLAAAVAEALRETGALAPHLGAQAVRVVPQSDGYYRCYLAGASLDESRLFADSLDELLAPLGTPRYIIPRRVAEAPSSDPLALLRSLRQLGPDFLHPPVVYHAVPSYLAANRRRVAAFARAWHRHVSPGRPFYYQHPEAQAVLELQRGADPFAVSSQLRTLWS